MGAKSLVADMFDSEPKRRTFNIWIDECSNVYGTNKCELTANLMECFLNKLISEIKGIDLSQITM